MGSLHNLLRKYVPAEQVVEIADAIQTLYREDLISRALDALAGIATASDSKIDVFEKRESAGMILNHFRQMAPKPVTTVNQTFLPGQVAPQVPLAEPAVTADENYDEDTLLKVARALTEEGMPPDGADNIIRILLNAGILFRERRPT